IRSGGFSMPIFAPSTHLRTHEVTNQPGPFAGYNLYLTDNALREAAQRDGGGWIEAPLRALGEAVGPEEVLDMGRSEVHTPKLHSLRRNSESVLCLHKKT